MRFSDFQSNQRVVQTLKAAAGGRRLSHAYLFHGTQGTGKRMLARIFAQALLCTGEEKPCGRCPHCLKFAHDAHPDFTVVQKPSDKNFILVDQIRTLREEIFIRPNEADHRVVLIENAEQMNPAAANALLKVLEEPPPYAVFLLTANNRDLLPETIASRCVCLEILEIPETQAERWLEAQFPGTDPKELHRAALYGGGNLGRSRSFLEEEAVRRRYGQALSLLSALANGKEFDVVAALAPFEGDKAGFLQLLQDFDGLLGSLAALPYGGTADPELAPIASKISPLRAAAMHDRIDGIRQRLFYNAGCPLTVALFGAQLKEI